MKKLFILLFTVVAMVAMTSSCDENKSFGIVYSLESTGITDGFVEMAFPNGDFKINGDADYVISWTNDLPKVFMDANSVSLEEALNSDDENLSKIANEANNWLDEAIKVVDYDGTYDIHVKGYVMETMTGLKFEIDKRFTNAVDPEPKPEAE